ncbi:MAG TPA: SurA N-terminal domain-containing protein [Candidatus Angelobacter sp.]|nr:SurA N-terminal domain-containing protein [Candidatus Angelobacter sp.]
MIQTRNRWRHAPLLGIALALGLTGCPKSGAGGDVMAKVNGYKVMRSEVDKSLKKQIAGGPQKLTTEQDQVLRLQLLQQIISLQLYLQKAEKLGIVATDEEVENRVSQAKAPYTKEEFAKKLEEMGMTEEDYKQEVRRNLTIDKLLNKEVASKVTISDADIQSYYNEHKSQFNVIEPQYYLAHIFVSAQPNAPSGPIPNKAQNEAQAKEKIHMIYNRLESGEDFASLAVKYSEDLDTARSGGELGAIPESQVKGPNTDAATRDAVGKLKPGQFTDIIPIVNPATQKVLGYRIVKLLGKEAAGQRDLNDPGVQQSIRNQLRNQREQFLRAAYDENLRDSAEVRNYYVEQILKDSGTK